jgi:RNA polymerase sigma-70 factor, ECF subfamily
MGAFPGSEVRAVADARPNEPPPLFEEVYTQLRAIARLRLANERRDHTLQATALVHEAWLKLHGDRPVEWGGRAQFFAAAAEAMRRILIEHARTRNRHKRGGGADRVSLDAIGDVADLASDGQGGQIIAFDEAFGRLEESDARLAGVVRLRFFAGLSNAQTAAALGVSERTVNNDWAYARAWLARELRQSGGILGRPQDG